MNQDIESLQRVISHRFSQVKLLRAALTHSSHANEQPTDVGHNERLEFLGDAVLELTVSEMLYVRFPQAREGELTRMRARLVSEPALARVAREIELDRHIYLGRGEDTQGGRERDSILSDALEAVFGAVFLDGGYEAAKQAVRTVFEKRMPAARDGERVKDAKSRLQEYTQKLFQERPVYVLAGSTGPEHDKIFEVVVTLPEGTAITATGPSLKKAEQNAAKSALGFLEAKT